MAQPVVPAMDEDVKEEEEEETEANHIPHVVYPPRGEVKEDPDHVPQVVLPPSWNTPHPSHASSSTTSSSTTPPWRQRSRETGARDLERVRQLHEAMPFFRVSRVRICQIETWLLGKVRILSDVGFALLYRWRAC